MRSLWPRTSENESVEISMDPIATVRCSNMPLVWAWASRTAPFSSDKV